MGLTCVALYVCLTGARSTGQEHLVGKGGEIEAYSILNVEGACRAL